MKDKHGYKDPVGLLVQGGVTECPVCGEKKHSSQSLRNHLNQGACGRGVDCHPKAVACAAKRQEGGKPARKPMNDTRTVFPGCGKCAIGKKKGGRHSAACEQAWKRTQERAKRGGKEEDEAVQDKGAQDAEKEAEEANAAKDGRDKEEEAEEEEKAESTEEEEEDEDNTPPFPPTAACRACRGERNTHHSGTCQGKQVEYFKIFPAWWGLGRRDSATQRRLRKIALEGGVIANKPPGRKALTASRAEAGRRIAEVALSRARQFVRQCQSDGKIDGVSPED
jgi:hypothetical protein